MPSLQALRDFKTSFNNIGGEISARAAAHIPFEDLALPDHEPAVQMEAPPGPETPPEAAPDFSGDFSPDFTFGDLNEAGLNLDDIPGSDDFDTAPDGDSFDDIPGAETSAQGDAQGDDADLLALLDTIPDDLGQPAEGPAEPETPDIDEAAAPPEPEAPAADVGEADDLLAGFDDLGTEPIDLGTEPIDLGTEPIDLGTEPIDLGTEPMDLGTELAAEGPAESLPAGFDEDGEVPAADDFQVPDELLSGLEDELNEAPADDFGEAGDGFDDLGTEPVTESPAELSDIDDFSIPGMDLGGEAPAELSAVDAEGGAEEAAGFDLGGEAPAELSDVDEFSIPGMDLGGEAPAELSAVDAEGGAEEAAGFDLGGEAPAELSDVDEFSIPGMDLGGEAPAGDSFAAFDLGGDTLEAAPGGTLSGAGEPGDMDEFTLPGIDDVFADGVPGAGVRAARGDAAGTGSSAEEVEEIQLTEEELDQFQKTLAGYPLNLRIACEELIAEQAVAPELMSRLVKLLSQGAPAREIASLAGKILGRTINIPRGFEKSTGAALEAEQGSFAYIFVHNFLPVLRLFLMIAVVAASLFYLIFQFVYTPLRAENIYKLGYERLFAGEYQRANDRFNEAFRIHRHKQWFYRYAEAFRDERQYLYAEEKYDELLRFYPRDKKGVLDYAAMETGYLRNYAKAEDLLRRNLLDYAPNDKDGLLALGDNSLAWGEVDRSKYEEARFAYARLLDLYGWTDPVVERMLRYFIRTDNLEEVLPLQTYFENKRRKISAESLAELGGYLLDKRLEEVRGVPGEYVEQIQGIRDLLLRAAKADPSLPEPHYHLARYYHSLNNAYEERITLETAIQAFDRGREGSVRRIRYRIDAQKRYADILINSREFFPAEEQLVKGVGIYEDALSRRLLARSPEFGKLYAGLGDLEYFTKAGNMEMALQYYRRSEQHGWAPPEMLYRMGSAHYQREEWRDALERFFTASAELPLNRRLLYALGNASYRRGDYFAAQGYYNRLLDILEADRARLPLLLPNDQPEYVELAERLMIARNNMGAAYEALAEQTADTRYRSRALALYSESARAWDALTRNPQTMVRSLPAPDTYGPGVNLPYLNSRYILYPQPGYEVQIFPRIDKDVLEPSIWENLAPQGSGLSQPPPGH